MPPKVTKNSLAKKYAQRAKKAHTEHKDDETVRPSGGRLPAGIQGGVAKLVRMEFGTFKEGTNLAGEQYFSASGVVVRPKEFDGVMTEGMQTHHQIIPLCDTPGRRIETFEEHWGEMLNALRLLGVDTSDLDYDDVEPTMAVLVEDGVYFRFRTWVGNKLELQERKGKWYVVRGGKDVNGPYATEAKAKQENPYVGEEPRVNEVWEGECSYEEDEQTDDAVTDESEVEEPENEEVETKEEPEAEEETSEVPDDLVALAEAADGGDESAAATLQEKAAEAGISDEEVEATLSWLEVAEMLNAAETESEEEPEETEEAEEEESESDWVPEKGDTYAIRPRGKKADVEVEVTAVYAGKQTVNVKDSNGKLYKDVPWDKLKDAE